MAHTFEPGIIPACIPVGRTFHVTELNIVCGFCCPHGNREGNLQQLMLFMPVNHCLEVNTAANGIHLYFLYNIRIQVLPLKLQRRSQGSVFGQFYSTQICDFPLFLLVIQINIPSIVHFGFILEHLQHIAALTRR
ncbi:hypothetical protein D3C75_555540 [compost metagenome]